MEPEIIGKRVRDLMKKHNIKIQELANRLKLEQESLKSKLEGKEEFYLDEMKKLKAIFQLNTKECDELFFQEKTEMEKM